MGKIRTPFYRIVVADARTKRDGRVIEEIGTYNPKTDPSIIKVDSERALHWLSVGAQPSEPVLALLRKTGDWQKYKGEPAPPPLLEQKPKRDKTEAFNEALKASHGDSAADATTAKRAPRKAAAPEADSAPAADAGADTSADTGADTSADTGADTSADSSAEPTES
jgi:small subunit ribosomal protein S16